MDEFGFELEFLFPFSVAPDMNQDHTENVMDVLADLYLPTAAGGTASIPNERRLLLWQRAKAVDVPSSA